MHRSAGPALALLAALAAAPLSGQERPREPERQRPDSVAPSDTVPVDTPAAPQAEASALGYEPAPFAIALTAGLPGGDEAHREPVLVLRLLPTATTPDSAVVDRVIRLQGGVSAGLSSTLSLGRTWALRLGAGYARADLDVDYSRQAELQGDGEDPLVDAARTTTRGPTDLEAIDVEATLRYRLPARKRLRPYLELGTVVSWWTADGPLADAGQMPADRTHVALTAGLGATLPLTRRLSARFHLARRLFRTPLRTSAPGDTLASATRQLPWEQRPTKTLLISRSTATTPFADGVPELVSPLRMEAGVSMEFGRPMPAPAAPVAPPDTTSPPGR